MDHLSDDVLPRQYSSTLPQQIKRKPNLSVDLPTLHEGRLFEPQPALESKVPSDSDDDATSNHEPYVKETKCIKELKKRKCCLCCVVPRWLRRIASWVYLRVGGVAAYLVFFLLIYTLLWIFTGEEALPPRCFIYRNRNGAKETVDKVVVCYGGTTMSIMIFYAIAFGMGQLVELVRLPGLLGMLMSGLILRCISVFITSYQIFMGGLPPMETQNNTATDAFYNPLLTSAATISPSNTNFNVTGQLKDPLLILAAALKVNKELSSALRQIALATILTRAGLGLEPTTLRRVWASMIRLTCLPCFTEALVCMVVSKYLMDWPWSWAAMMGFIVAAVSPAVVVPNMLRLEIAGWGVAAGIPTLIMAASSLDDVIAITGFGISQTIAFAKGDIANVAISGPLEVLAGACLGFCLAIILWLLPPPGLEHSNSLRCTLLYSMSIAAIIGTIKMSLPGAGALCCLVCSLTCSAGWQHGMPWRFKRTSQRSPLSREPSFEDDSGIDKPTDRKASSNKDWAIHRSSDSVVDSMSTEHHEYYQQHLRSLRRLLKETGEIGTKNALATVTRGRRFSLPEPKPEYEDDDYDEMMNLRRRRSNLTRSFSAYRKYSTKGIRKRTVSESLRPIIAEEGMGKMEPKLHVERNLPSIAEINTPSAAVTTAAEKALKPSQAETKASLLELDKVKGMECLKVMRGYMATCWWFVQPLLFCLIGADIPVEKLQVDTIGLGIASILISLVFRIGASVLAVTPSPLKWKERIFVGVAWIPKATVQAAIGPIALDSARATGDPTFIKWGEQIITFSAMSILLTAPLAAILIPLVAPYLLHQDPIFIPVETAIQNEDTDADSDNGKPTLETRNCDELDGRSLLYKEEKSSEQETTL